MAMDKKRPRDETNDASASECDESMRRKPDPAKERGAAKRLRVGAVGLGLGTFAGLVGKAFRATASVFGSGGQER